MWRHRSGSTRRQRYGSMSSLVPRASVKVGGTLLTFPNNANGTAALAGKPKTAGTYHMTIKAVFGSGANKYVVIQSFTLTVDSS